MYIRNVLRRILHEAERTAQPCASTLLALEPRLLFDAAVAASVAAKPQAEANANSASQAEATGGHDTHAPASSASGDSPADSGSNDSQASSSNTSDNAAAADTAAASSASGSSTAASGQTPQTDASSDKSAGSSHSADAPAGDGAKDAGAGHDGTPVTDAASSSKTTDAGNADASDADKSTDKPASAGSTSSDKSSAEAASHTTASEDKAVTDKAVTDKTATDKTTDATTKDSSGTSESAKTTTASKPADGVSKTTAASASSDKSSTETASHTTTSEDNAVTDKAVTDKTATDKTTDAATKDSSGSSESAKTTTVVVIDKRVNEYQTLVEGVSKNATVVIVGAGDNGVAKIGDALAAAGKVDSLQIYSHGSSGEVIIGDSVLNTQSIADHYGQSLADWADFFSQSGDILLYGCSVGEGDKGQAFMDALAKTTGTDVAASDNATGNATAGGDWVLEKSTGAIETTSVLSSGAASAYGGLLAAPGITDSAPSIRSTNEDTTASVSGLSVSADAGATLTVTLSVGKGTLDVGSTEGLTLEGGSFTNAASLSFSGLQDAINAALASLSYKPNADINGADTLAISVSDGTSTTSQNISLAVTPANDAPQAHPTNLTVAEGQANVAFGADQFGLTDADLPSGSHGGVSGDQVLSQEIVQIESLPTHGTLTFNGNAVEAGFVFSYDQLSSLRYSHGGADVNPNDAATTHDSFNFIVRDGAGGDTGTRTMDIVLTPVNQAPDVANEATVYEGQHGSVGLTVTDADGFDAPAATTVEVTSVPDRGQLYFDANGDGQYSAGEEVTAGFVFNAADAAKLSYRDTGDDPAADITFTVKVTDSGGGEGAGKSISVDKTLTVHVASVDDDPVYDGQTSHTFDAGVTNTVALNGALLSTTDVDSADANLVYTLTGTPETGTIQFYHNGTWYNLDTGATFTQVDIDSGLVRFHYAGDASLSGSDSFTFQVRDSAQRPGFDATGQPDGTTYAGGVRATPDSTEPLRTITFHFTIEHPYAFDGSSGGYPSLGTGDPTQEANDGLKAGTNTGFGGTEYQEGEATPLGQGQLEYTLTRTITNTDHSTSTETMPADQVVYTVTSRPSHGSLIYDADHDLSTTGDQRVLDVYSTFTQDDINSGRIWVRHDGSEDLEDFFKFTVSGGNANSQTGTFGLTADPVNDAPTATASDPVKVQEGGTVSIKASNMGMSDVDGSGTQFTGPGQAPNYEYSQPNTLTWSIGAADMPQYGKLYIDNDGDGIYGVGDTLVAAGADYAQALAAKLIYVHDGTENFNDSYTFTVTDEYGAQSAPATVAIRISAVNDSPAIAPRHNEADPDYGLDLDASGHPVTGSTAAVNNYLTVDEGGSKTIDATYLKAVDPDSTSIQRQYKITGATQEGTLKLNGKTLGVGSTFTQDDIDNGRLSYTHNGKEPYKIDPGDPLAFQDYFTFVVDDGAGGTPVASRFDIAVTPLNNSPVISQAPTTIDQGAETITVFGVGDNRVVVDDPDISANHLGSVVDCLQVTVTATNQAGDAFHGAFGNLGGDVAVSITETGKVVFSGTKAQVQAALDQMTFSSGGDLDLSLKLTVTVSDFISAGQANGGTVNQDKTTPAADNSFDLATKEITLRSSATNDTPTGTGPTDSLSVNEDTTTTAGYFTGNRAFQFTDADAFDSTNNTVTVQVEHGQVTATAAGGAAISGSGTGTLTITGTLTGINATLLGLGYKGSTDYNGSDCITVTYNDQGNLGVGGPKSAVLTKAITVVPVNDTPTVTVPSATQVINSPESPLVFSSANHNAISIADVKDTGTGQTPTDNYTVTLTTDIAGAKLTLGATTGLAITGDGTGNVILTGTMADINNALNGLTFTPGEYNGDVNATITVKVQDLGNGGTGIGGVGGDLVASKDIHVQVSSINDAPTISSQPTTVSMNEDTTLSFASTPIQFADSDTFGSTNNTVTVHVDTGKVTATASGTAAISGSGTGTLTITGSLADINATLQSLKYASPADYNSTNPVTLTAVFNDQGNLGSGGAKTVTATVDITVTPVNDAPTGSGSVTLPSVPEDTDAALITGKTVAELVETKFSDAKDNQSASGGSNADSFYGVVVVGVANETATKGTWQYSTDGTTWTDITSASASNGLVLTKDATVRFVPKADWNGTPTGLTTRLIETGGATPATGNRVNVSGANSGGTTIYSNSANQVVINTAVTPVNDAPTATTPNVAMPDQYEDGAAGDIPARTVGQTFGSVFSDTKDQIAGGSAANTFAGVYITSDPSTAAGHWEYHTAAGWQHLPGDIGADNALFLSADTQLRYVPAENANDGTATPPTLTGRLVEASSSTPATGDRLNVTIGTGGTSSISNEAVNLTAKVIAVNDAPTVSLPASTSLAEDGSVTFSQADGNAIHVSDVDYGETGSSDEMRVTLEVGHGTLDVHDATGVTISDNGTGSVTLTGSLDAINAALDGGVTYTPSANYNGTDSLTVVANDRGNVGIDPGTLSPGYPIPGTGDHASEEGKGVMAITVTPVNDAPTATTPNVAMPDQYEDGAIPARTVGETFGSVFSDSKDQIAGGSAANAFAGVYITSAPSTAAGHWEYHTGTGWQHLPGDIGADNALFLSADTQLRYVPTENANDGTATPPTLTGRLVETSASTPATGDHANVTTGTGGTSSISNEAVNLTAKVIAVNDAPTVSLPASTSLAEDGSVTFSQANHNAIHVSDVDYGEAGSSDEMRVTLEVGHGTLDVHDATGVTISDNGTGSVTLTGSLDAINAALDGGVTYTPNADYNGTDSLTVVANDRGNVGIDPGTLSPGYPIPGTADHSSEQGTGVMAITVTPVYDAPVISLPTTATTAEDGAVTFSGANSVQISDVDYVSGDISVTLDVGHGTLHMLDAAGLTVTDNGHGSVTITGGLAAINSALQNGLTYTPDADFNGSDTLTVTYGAGTASQTITVTPVNDAPTGSGSVTLPSVPEDATDIPGKTVADLVGAKFSDAKDNQSAFGGSDADSFYGVVVVGVADETATKGTWQYSTDGITWTDITSASADNGLVLTKDATVRFVPNADWNGTPTGLTTRLIETGGATPATGDRIDVSGANSGDATIYSDSANQVVINTTVTPVDDAPVISLPATAATTEDGAVTFSGPDSVQISDVDYVSGDIISVTLDVGHGTLHMLDTTGLTVTDNGHGSVTITGELDAINLALQNGLTYTPDADFNGSDTLTVTSGEGTASRTITVTPVNDAPTGSGSVTLPSVPGDATHITGKTVADLVGAKFSDARDNQSAFGGSDADSFYGVVVVGVADETATKGTWQYSTDGITWTDITSASDSNGLVLTKDARVRFVPKADWNGTPTGLTTRLIETGGATPATGDRIDVSGTGSGGVTIYSDSANQVVINTAVTPVAPSSSGDSSGSEADTTPAPTPQPTPPPVTPEPEIDVPIIINQLPGVLQTDVTPNLNNVPGILTGTTTTFETPLSFAQLPVLSALQTGAGTAATMAGSTADLGLVTSQVADYGARQSESLGAHLQGLDKTLSDIRLPELTLDANPQDKIIQEDIEQNFSVPKTTFRHSDSGERLTYEAKQADGRPLPDWLQFDRESLTFSGTPPAGSKSLDIVVTAKDSKGNQAAAHFHITVQQQPGQSRQSDQDGSPGKAPHGGNHTGNDTGNDAPKPDADQGPGDGAWLQPQRDFSHQHADWTAPWDVRNGQDAAIGNGKPSFNEQINGAGLSGLMRQAAAFLEMVL